MCRKWPEVRQVTGVGRVTNWKGWLGLAGLEWRPRTSAGESWIHQGPLELGHGNIGNREMPSRTTYTQLYSSISFQGLGVESPSIWSSQDRGSDYGEHTARAQRPAQTSTMRLLLFLTLEEDAAVTILLWPQGPFSSPRRQHSLQVRILSQNPGTACLFSYPEWACFFVPSSQVLPCVLLFLLEHMSSFFGATGFEAQRLQSLT